jgi:hypothetical protein
MNLFTSKLLALMGSSLLFAAACSQEEPVEYVNGGTSPSSVQKEKTGSSPVRKSFRYGAKVGAEPIGATLRGLNLADADATAFSISLTGCASGHTAVVTELLAYLEVYEFDRDCLAKLTTFTLNGKVYTPKAGSLFDTWQAGDQAVFEVAGADPADELNVEVIETIANPVVAAGTVHYQFSEIDSDDAPTTIGESVVRESAALAVDGHAAPNFTIKQVELVGITADGNGEFRIQLECNGQAVTGVGNDILCYDVRLDSIRMVLVEDTYGGVLVLNDLETIYTAAGGGKAIDMVAEAFGAGEGTPVLANGGFITAAHGDADVMVISGAVPMHTHPNMIFILKSGPSYYYYNVDVTTIVQSDDN